MAKVYSPRLTPRMAAPRPGRAVYGYSNRQSDRDIAV